MTEPSRAIAVKPIITYPREALVGKTYLMTIDVQPENEFEWQYDEEEYPIYCAVDSEPFISKPVREPVVVLHRFGGSYGAAQFLLTAVRAMESNKLNVRLLSKWGVPIETIFLTDVRIHSNFLDVAPPTNLKFTEKLFTNDQFSDLDKDSVENEQSRLDDWRQEHNVPYWDENDSWNTFHDGELPPIWNKPLYRYHNRPPSSLNEQPNKRQRDQSISDDALHMNKELWNWLWENFPGWDE